MTGEIKDRVYASFDGNGPQRLEDLCRGLLSEQQASWPELKHAYDSLGSVRSRDIRCDGFSVRLVFNPGRAVNTMAAVSPPEISQRPCFLCLANLPAEQKGIIYRGQFLILGNPRPALPFHLTIAHLSHRPQAISDHIEMFLQIAADLGRGFTTLYNGPRCGASAPDHLHFQAVPSGKMPIEQELDAKRDLISISPRVRASRVPVLRASGFGREVVLIEGDETPLVAAAFRDYMQSLKNASTSTERADEEPMLNAAASFDGKGWRLLVFPRRAHRPAAFYREDEERVLVSPAVMEMAGIIVTPMERDFYRLDAAAIESMYREVSFHHA
ncbi:MAG: DUF4922 domain-containing protein [Syntrophorhabdaceae bacterium]|nr:DUF4922 domain-containing protein [Syntrophorhabdaceae bacterium]